ncbi:MAG: metallophosphoesterase [Holophaga sp.]|nr:metallophosphoesterase [Holophaga sp.]
MIFLIFITLITGLQVLHRRLLRQVFHRRFDRWVLAALILIHLPLALYMGVRLTGGGSAGNWLRPMARAGAYFQLLTVMDLLVWAVASLVWRWTHLWRRAPEGQEGQESPENPQRRKFLRQTSVVGVTLAGYGAMRGSIEARSDPDIVRLELSFPGLPPGLDGLRLVQLSDLHSGPLVRPEQVERWRRLAQGERPELLVITGDLVDSLPSEAGAVVDAFRDFPAPLGCFAILGNHDYFTDPRPIWRAMEGIGIRFLENRNALVTRRGATLGLVGLQDPMAKHGRFRDIAFGLGPRPALAVQGLPDDAWRLCLSHRPSDWHLARQTGAQLTLSGHTHGGQVNLIPGVSSAILLGKYTQGLYHKDNQSMYVNRGLGVVGLPIRVGAPPEITVITLRRR